MTSGKAAISLESVDSNMASAIALLNWDKGVGSASLLVSSCPQYQTLQLKKAPQFPDGLHWAGHAGRSLRVTNLVKVSVGTQLIYDGVPDT